MKGKGQNPEYLFCLCVGWRGVVCVCTSVCACVPLCVCMCVCVCVGVERWLDAVHCSPPGVYIGGGGGGGGEGGA